MAELEILGTDVDMLLLEILRAVFDDPSLTYLGDRLDVKVVGQLPGDYATRYPIVRAVRPPASGAAVDARWLDMARAQVDVFDDDETRAIAIALACRKAYFDAQDRQTVYPHGSIPHFEESQAPAVLHLAGAPKGQTRVQATYLLGVTPPL